ncbi:MAG TPA: glycosyltransferase family 39 protein [Ktedonobacterales bacterium]
MPETQRRTAVRSPLPPTSPNPNRWLARAQPLKRHGLFVLVFALAIFLLTINVNAPWQASHEDNGLVFESAAINHIRFGLGFTKGQDFFDATVNPPVITPTDIHPQGVSDAQEFQYLLTGPANPELYGDHPALLGLTVAGSLLVFGYHFWVVRLVPIAFTLLALLLFYRLMTLLVNVRVAAFASLLFCTFPIAAFYGRDVAHEAPTMCCEIGMALCYVLWRRSGRNGWLAGVAGCVALGGAYGWPMLFFAWILFALDSLAERRTHWRLALATAALSTVVFGLVITQIAWVNGWSLTRLHSMFAERSGSYGADPGTFQAYFWLKWILHHNFFDFGPWTMLALPFALVFLWRQFRQDGLSPRIQMIALFGLGGVTHILVFRDGAYVHDYWQFYLIPFYGALLGWGSVVLAQRLAAHPVMERLNWALARRQSALLVAFAALALVMAAPFIYQLYATGHLFQFPGVNPVRPLLAKWDTLGRGYMIASARLNAEWRKW